MSEAAEAPTRPREAEGEATPDSVAEALDNLEIVNIFPIQIRASLDGPPNRIDLVDSDVEIEYLAQAGAFSNRFEWQVSMSHDAGDGEEGGVPVASFGFTIQVDYETSDGYRVADPEALAITRTTGLFAAYPYARELLQNLTGRLQLDPLVMGMLMRGEIRPAGITRVDRSPSGD